MDIDFPCTFFSTICHVCKCYDENSGLKKSLKQCTGCRLVLYCSVEHQKKHWRIHKSFCKAIQKLTNNMNVPAIYEEAVSVKSRKEWCSMRFRLKMLCEEILKRPLTVCETEMINFPRICLLCRKYDPANAVDCEKCHCVTYCSEEHMKEDANYHNNCCQELKLGFDVDMAAFHGTLPDIELKFGENKSCQSSKDFISAFMRFANSLPSLQANPIAPVVYFSILSCPLTFIYCVFLMGLHFSSNLVIHIVGAGNFESQYLDMWDIVFHWLPNLVDLYLIFIGPDVIPSEVSLCSKCESNGYKLTIEFCPDQLYHEYVNAPQFVKANAIFMFNCGLSEFSGGQQDTWKNSIGSIMSSGCPVVLTSYTLTEAENDIKRLVDYEERETLIRCEKNIFAAKKPVRDWEQFYSSSDTLVFYHNAFMSILAP